MRRRTAYAVVGVAIIAGAVVLGAAMRPRGNVITAIPDDPSVVTERWGEHVENGEAFDRAEFDLGGRAVLAVPTSAVVRTNGAGPPPGGTSASGWRITDTHPRRCPYAASVARWGAGCARVGR